MIQVSENSDPLEALKKLTDTAVEETNNWLEEEFGVWCSNPPVESINCIKDLDYTGIQTTHTV